MKEVVGRERLGYAATVCPDGTPNVSPKGTTAVWDDQHLVFCDLRSPRTIANLRENPAIELNVVDPIVRKGYRFKGEAKVVESGPLFEELLEFYESRIADPRGRVRSVVLVRVDRALPLTSPAYDLGLSEDEIRERWKAHYCDE
jgi:predicted pyridoxine 5'-phosphate oxidase superfamily flavin-nucleotide-binding protein